jgi:hypothetical protein
MAETILLEVQIGFKKSRSCVDRVFTKRQSAVKRIEHRNIGRRNKDIQLNICT